MPLKREDLEALIFGTGSVRRYTQDSPVMPDVWLEYGENPGQRLDLLLSPHNQSSAGQLARELEERLALERRTEHWQALHGAAPRPSSIAYNQSSVAVELFFDELVRVVLPMTKWWSRYVWKGSEKSFQDLLAGDFRGLLDQYFSSQALADGLKREEKPEDEFKPTTDLLWMMEVVGRIAVAHDGGTVKKRRKKAKDAPPPSDDVPVPSGQVLDAVAGLLKGLVPVDPEARALVWSVNRNRSASTAVSRSTLAVKADAARRLFELSCKDLRWAVIDSGVDARHPAFRCRDKEGKPAPLPAEGEAPGDFSKLTRVIATYDFTRVRDLLRPGGPDPAAMSPEMRAMWEADTERAQAVQQNLRSGRDIDWDLLKDFLEVPHTRAEYRPPRNEHGTHVAGILAGDWSKEDPEMPEEKDLRGVCPDLLLYDLRVLKDDGSGDEFSVISALQFVRHLNAHKDHVVVHGANTSLSIKHDVANFACGRTPVCEECERLVNAGVVVVAAAGNQGYLKYLTPSGQIEGYHSISITDPGNTDGVITVGATHRYRPHTYGVSYFSSRGPTGDGRLKPDLVAPGEKIVGPIPNDGIKRKDGTSMAAPHVSGAAALLMARYSELIGDPKRIKRILCSTATDLGRERYFQGNGMLDVLRALQSV